MKERQLPPPNVIYVRPGDPQLTFDEDLEIFRYEGKKFTGVKESVNEGNWIQLCEYRDGLSDGWCRTWNVKGQIIQESQYWRGWPHGVTRKWNDSGILTKCWVDEFEIPIAVKEWDENGVLVYNYRLSPREECQDEWDVDKWDHIDGNRQICLERYGWVAPRYFDRIDTIPLEGGTV